MNVNAVHLLPNVQIGPILFWMKTAEQKGSHGDCAHAEHKERPSAGIFFLSGKDMTFAGSFELSVTFTYCFLLMSKCLLVTVSVSMDYSVL